MDEVRKYEDRVFGVIHNAVNGVRCSIPDCISTPTEYEAKLCDSHIEEAEKSREDYDRWKSGRA